MGAYLSSPVTAKDQESGSSKNWRYGATTMQGWRTNQEDAHNCIIDEDQFGYFAVYDGHGGAEVARYAAKVLPELLRRQEEWTQGRIEDALVNAFIQFDKLLLDESAIAEMRRIKEELEGTKEKKKSVNMDDEELFEEAIALSQEANISIEDLISQYAGIKKKLIQRLEKRERNGDESPYEKKVKRAKIVEEESESEDGKFSGDEINGDAVKEEIELANQEVSDGKVEIRSKVEVIIEKSVNGDVNSPQQNSPSDLEPPLQKSVDEPKHEADVQISAKDELKQDLKEESDVTDEEKPTTASGLSQTNVDLVQDESEDEDYMEDEGDDEDEEESEDESDDDNYLLAMDGGLEASTPAVDSGTTACVVALFQDRVIVANVGDSRAVLSRKGEAIDLSVDHKPEDDVEKTRILKAGGQISEDGRVNGGLNLSRALGDHYYKTNKALPLEEQMISPKPDIVVLEITPDDEFVVLACDGIWNSMTSQEVVNFVRERLDTHTLTEIGAEICDRCCAPNTEGDGTGCDNMTFIVVELKSAS